MREKQEEVDQELESRITNIMQNERHEHEKALKEAEREIFEVNRQLATVQASSERQQKEVIALRQETSILTSKIAQIFEEKALLTVEMQNKLEHQRQESDKENR